MIKEDYVSYEVAKLLKEKGFDIPCKYAWHGGIKVPDFHRHSINFNGGEYKDLRTKWYSAPTHQMAMKWLREKGIFIWIGQCSIITKDPATQEYHPVVINNNDGIMEEYLGYIIGYSNAVEAALKYCLTKLI